MNMLLRQNLYFRSLFLAVAVSVALAGDQDFGLRLTTESLKEKENTQYSFQYFVKDDKTGDYKTQKETKQGDSVHGSYTLAEPNGDLRTVTYKAGPGTGFEAKVDVLASGSPVKQTPGSDVEVRSVSKTTNSMAKENSSGLESNVSRFPGGFRVDVSSKPQSEQKTEMGMKFSLKTSAMTEPITDRTVIVGESKPTEKSEIDSDVAEAHGESATENPDAFEFENSTVPTESREMSKDPIEKEIDEAINSMPKLPELVLSDNKTHFKFHKDPEEALLDERITQIARQLAETSLRREYEERKLGHFIPISVSSIEPSFSKSFKFRNDPPTFRPSESSPFRVLTQLRVIPQYIYSQTSLPGVLPMNHRLAIVNEPIESTQQWEQKPQEMTTTPSLKPDKSEVNKIPKVQEKKFSTQYKIADREPSTMMPVHLPTFFQFFTPYVMHFPGTSVPGEKTEPQHATTARQYPSTGDSPTYYDTTLYAPVTTVAYKSTDKL